MNIPTQFRKVLAQAAKVAAKEAAQEIQQANGLDSVQGVLDVIQRQMGNVNLDNMEEAVVKACMSCLKDDIESQARVAAFVTGVYMQHEIRRAAEVGGSLRERFSTAWFPHIKERELRFAKEIDSDLEEVLYLKLLKELEEMEATPIEIAEAANAIYSGRPESHTSMAFYF